MMQFINYERKKFKSIVNASNGDVSSETIFHYRQQDNVAWAEYEGGGILLGHLIGTVNEQGILDMRYHHVNEQGELMTGKCTSVPQLLDDGRLRVYETWEWTCRDFSKGQSIIEEIISDSTINYI